MKHNNQIPNNHFRKQWQRRVMTWFDQAGQKKARRTTRALKAARVAPRPVDTLRPAVRCQTVKYNTKIRSGRGFTAQELKAAGMTRQMAMSVGISVDHRRRNRCQESLELNKARIEAYKSKLILLPKKGSAAVLAAAQTVSSVAAAFPIVKSVASVEAARAVSAEEVEFSAYKTLRAAQSTARYAGIRAKRAAIKAEEAANKLK
jgi:large subunit ribosomal protein L13e